MKIYVLSVRDQKANAYAAPMFYAQVGMAERAFADAINTEDPTSNLWKHPEDFELWLLATYEDETGKFENLDRPQSIAVGTNVKIQKRTNT